MIIKHRQARKLREEKSSNQQNGIALQQLPKPSTTTPKPEVSKTVANGNTSSHRPRDTNPCDLEETVELESRAPLLRNDMDAEASIGERRDAGDQTHKSQHLPPTNNHRPDTVRPVTGTGAMMSAEHQPNGVLLQPGGECHCKQSFSLFTFMSI